MIKNYLELTPVEKKIDNIFIKRDDLFKPYNSGVNGGKLRQCISLLKNKHHYGIISVTSIYSPQSAIVSSVAKWLQLECIILLGGEKKTDMVRLSEKLGAKIIREKTGRHGYLLYKAKQISKKNNYTIVDYGMNAETNIKDFYDTNASQVKNIPDQIDDLVITCGSGITATGVIYGISKYKKNVKCMYLIGTAPNRMKKITERINMIGNEYGIKIKMPEIVYDNLYEEKGFVYEKKENTKFFNIKLHPNYEAKTFKRYIKKYYNKKKKVLLWIVGGPAC